MLRSVFLAGLAVVLLLAGLVWWTSTVVLPADPDPVPSPLVAGRLRPQGDGYVLAVPRPDTLNPFTTDGAVARRLVLRYVLDPLMDFDVESGRLQPALATSVDSDPDLLTHRFTLRDGVTFSDGTALTMEDVLFTFEVANDPEMVLGSIGPVMRMIDSVRALDPRTLELRLKQWHFAALQKVASGYLVTSKLALLAAVQDAARRAGLPPPSGPGAPHFARLLSQVRICGPGTGPYRIHVDPGAAVGTGASWTMPQNPTSWRLEAFPEQWNLAFLRLSFATDRAVLHADLKAQKVDWVFDPQADKVLAADHELATHYHAVAFDHFAIGHMMVVWNCRREPFSDPRVRRALALLFDREAIVERAFLGHARVAHGWFRPGTKAYPSEPPSPADPTRAEALLKEAGYGVDRPLQVALTIDARQETHRQVFAEVRNLAARAGVQIVSRTLEDGPMERARRVRDFDAMLVVKSHEAWIDPHDEFHSSQANDGMNWACFVDARSDQLLEQARSERDDNERMRLYREFQDRLTALQPVTVLVHPLAVGYFHRRFQNARPGLRGLTPESWWVEPGDRIYGR